MLLKVLLQKVRMGFPSLKGRASNAELPQRSICGAAASIPRAEDKAWGMVSLEPCRKWVGK